MAADLMARRGEIPDPGDSAGKTFGDAVAEWLRYVEHEKGRRSSTLRDYRNTAESTLEPEFGKDTPLEKITSRVQRTLCSATKLAAWSRRMPFARPSSLR
jgi:hypothetical protein